MLQAFGVRKWRSATGLCRPKASSIHLCRRFATEVGFGFQKGLRFKATGSGNYYNVKSSRLYLGVSSPQVCILTGKRRPTQT